MCVYHSGATFTLCVLYKRDPGVAQMRYCFVNVSRLWMISFWHGVPLAAIFDAYITRWSL
jgi:hypothetical protein